MSYVHYKKWSRYLFDTCMLTLLWLEIWLDAAQWLRAESGVKSTNQQISHFYQALGEIAWHNNKWTNMIKIGQKILMITSLFYLRQYFFVMTSLIFIQTFGNFSFVCNYWTYLFESYWVVISKYQKTMTSLLFIVYWCKHIFLMIIQIFTENILPLIFEPLISGT